MFFILLSFFVSQKFKGNNIAVHMTGKGNFKLKVSVINICILGEGKS